MTTRSIVWLPLLCLFVSSAEAQQRSRCANCHYSVIETPAPYHLIQWESSPHGRSDVGCEKCHGGDASTFESFLAHRGVLNSRNPASPVHRRNLPKTCGSCHIGQFVEFQKSRHYALIQEGNSDPPVCTTCHSEVAAHLLSPRRLEKKCAGCHGAGKLAPRPEYPAQGRELLERIMEIRALLNEVRPLIRRIRDDSRREDFEAAYRQAEVPLEEAVEAGHSFVFDQLQERSSVARSRAEALLDRLANPQN